MRNVNKNLVGQLAGMQDLVDQINVANKMLDGCAT